MQQPKIEIENENIVQVTKVLEVISEYCHENDITHLFAAGFKAKIGGKVHNGFEVVGDASVSDLEVIRDSIVNIHKSPL